jgi:hypothetical protein
LLQLSSIEFEQISTAAGLMELLLSLQSVLLLTYPVGAEQAVVITDALPYPSPSWSR